MVHLHAPVLQNADGPFDSPFSCRAPIDRLAHDKTKTRNGEASSMISITSNLAPSERMRIASCVFKCRFSAAGGGWHKFKCNCNCCVPHRAAVMLPGLSPLAWKCLLLPVNARIIRGGECANEAGITADDRI